MQVGTQTDDEMRTVFGNMDSRKLLTCIYILKSIIKTLKNYVRTHHDQIIRIVMNLVQVIENVETKPDNKEMADEK